MPDSSGKALVVGSGEVVVKELNRLLGSEHVVTDPVRLEERAWDALTASRIHPLRRPRWSPPLCVAFPGTTAEVREVVLLANELRVPVVPYGGGSGLMGGAVSLQAGIVLDLGRMAALEVDREAQVARVQAGLVLQSLKERLCEEELLLGHDPWTLPVATVGGAISTNSLGYRGGKYGSMGDQVLGLEVVLPQGEILRTRAVPKSSAGIDLKHLFIGGEGCFGIVTEATLRVFPLPEKRSLQAFRFSSFEAGFRASQRIFSAGLRPALLDLGEDTARSGGGADLFLAFEGAKEMVQAEDRLSRSICEGGGGWQLPREEAERFWRDRHVIAYRFMRDRRGRRGRGEEAPYRDWIHVALAGSRVLAFRRAAIEILTRRGLRLQESGLWTRPELFSMRLSLEDRQGNGSALEEGVEELLRLVQEMGGSMEYCHGVGVKLAPLMAAEHGYGLPLMRQIKRLLDPKAIMNPGKMGL